MNHLLNITKKELRELLTPSSVISIVVVMIMMCAMGAIIGGEAKEASTLTPVGIINADSDDGVHNYGDLAIDTIRATYISTGITSEDVENYMVYLDSPYNDSTAILKELESKGITSALVISPDFSEKIINEQKPGSVGMYYTYTNGGMFSSASSAINEALMANVNTAISGEIIRTLGSTEPAFVQNPVDYGQKCTLINGRACDGITPLQISTSLMSQNMMIPLIIMIIIVMIGSIVISSMGNEKENKTLETLLTLPVKRSTIVSGKLLAAAITGLVYGVAYMIGMSVYLGGVTTTVAGVDLAEYGLKLDPLQWVILGIMVFFAIMSALGLCMILGAFVKNYKAAQTMTLPISVLALIPMFVCMFIGWNSLPVFGKIALFIIPFTHPMMAMDNLMFGDTALVLGGLAYLILFSVAMILITVKIYKSDVLLTGIGQTKFVRTLNKVFAKKKA